MQTGYLGPTAQGQFWKKIKVLFDTLIWSAEVDLRQELQRQQSSLAQLRVQLANAREHSERLTEEVRDQAASDLASI